MAWLWDSWEEYVDAVHPWAVEHSGLLRLAHRRPWCEVECELLKAVQRLSEATTSLRKLGFSGKDHDRPPKDCSVIEQAEPLVEDAIFAADELLLYHKRLAKSRAAYGFLHENHLMKHWERYEQSGRISKEIHQFVKDVGELLSGYEQFVLAEDDFIVGGLELPESLESDFRLARNLFSVGFDEVGLLMAGRGLEGVLRRVARVRKITLVAKGRTFPASEADLYDLIETMNHVRWKTKRTRLITPETKALLHYLRTLRNSCAHAAEDSTRFINARETATIIAETANRLWNEVANSRARLAPTAVQKTWG